MTRPVFIVGSGRSGTAALAKLLAEVPGVEMHHEYLCTHIQPVAVRYHMGLADTADVRAAVACCHGAALRLTEAAVWGDSSNKLSWIMPVLAEMFPDARFAHVVRDGRKVASSYFHKLGDECYDDAAVDALSAWVDGDAGAPMPPPEKRYWWPIPRRGDPLHRAFRRFDRFRRVAWHWAEVNAAILRHAENLGADRVARFRLEDLVADQDALAGLFAFLDVPFAPALYAAFRRPHNVNRPEDWLLTARQRRQFDALAGPVMAALGYDGSPEYRVDYNPPVAAE
ncbi:MAG: sulfotransferase [Alphaproteobacteria bacterium]